jgi:hypothetical protein
MAYLELHDNDVAELIHHPEMMESSKCKLHH